MSHLSETCRFLQSSTFWEARHALIGQLSSALWLAKYLKRETEMLRPSPYCDAVSRRDDTKTIKPIINEAFVASNGDIITNYNDLYCLITRHVASRRINMTMSAFAWTTGGPLLWHPSSASVKFADDTTVIGLITDNDETAYREEASTLTKWCQENHLSLNIDKTKELVVDFRRQSREHTPISIDKTPVERVNSFKFLGVHITEDLTWSTHTDAVLKKAHQRLFFLRRLRKFGMSPSILRSFYTCTVESILTGCITAWFGNSTAGNRKALQRVVRTARHIVGGELPSLQDIYPRRCIRKARRIIKDSSHPSHRLLSLLPSGRRLRSIRSRTSRLRDSFFPQAIRLMNSQN